MKKTQENGMWFEFHKSLSHNTKDYRTTKSLMMETHENKEESKVAGTCIEESHEQVIEVDPYVMVATTKILPWEDEERLFHS